MIENHANYFTRFQKWYINQCNGSWEHKFGIKIDTIDNPGWSIRIDLTDTPLEKEKFLDVKMDITENNWILCWVKERQFQGGGGPQNLIDLIKTFISWGKETDIQKTSNNGILDWLQNWYFSQCNEDWEHRYGVRIDTTDNPGWSLTIDLYDTELESIGFSKVKIDTEEGWLSCWVENQKFEGRCSPNNLKTTLKIFKSWAEKISDS